LLAEVIIAFAITSKERTKHFVFIMDRVESMIVKFALVILATAALVAAVCGLLALAPSPYVAAVGGTGLATVVTLAIAAWRRVRKWRKLAELGGHGKSSRKGRR
jgi:membrane protein implicated in regulation of membrane protease activity